MTPRASIGMALLLVVVLVAVLAPAALGATPEPSVIGVGDPRSEGQGPGLVGDPLLVAIGVVALGGLTAVLTALVVRMRRED